MEIFSRFSTADRIDGIDIVLFDVMNTAVCPKDGTSIQPVIDFHSWLAHQGARTFWTSGEATQARTALKKIGIDAEVHNPMLLLARQSPRTGYAAVNDDFLPVMDAEAWLNPHDREKGKPFLEKREYLHLINVPV